MTMTTAVPETTPVPAIPVGNDRFLPEDLCELVGQIRMTELIVVHLDASQASGQPFPHLLLVGPPGSGKTTVARIVAATLGVPFASMSTPPANRNSLANLLSALGDDGGCLFVDEIHEWSKSAQDSILTLLEEGFLDCGWGRMEFPNLTVIAATTEREKIRKPLMQRFPLRPAIEPYTDGQMSLIAGRMCRAAGVDDYDWDDAQVFGRAAGGVPRQCRTFALHAAAMATSRGTVPTPAEVLEMAGVELDGLTQDHLDYLHRLRELNGEAGLTTLATRMRLPESEVRDLERLLLDRDLVTLTKSGRMLRTKGHQRLKGIPDPD